MREDGLGQANADFLEGLALRLVDEGRPDGELAAMQDEGQVALVVGGDGDW